MELNDSSIKPFQEIVGVLEKWKIVPMKHWPSLLEETTSRAGAYRLFDNVEKNGLAKKIKLAHTNAHVLVPSEALIDYLNIPINNDQFDHDKVVSFVAAAFMKTSAFKDSDPAFEHESPKFHSGSLIPDIVLVGKSPKTGGEINLAVEVEISRKKKDKVSDKLARYMQDERFDLVIYAVKSEEMFEFIKKRIYESLNREYVTALSSKVAVVLIDNYVNFPNTIFKSRCLFRDREGVFGDFF